MKIYKYISLALIASLTLLAACSDDDKDVKAVNIVVKQAKPESGDVSVITMNDNEPLQLEAFIMPTNTANQSVTYELWGKGNGSIEITPDGLMTSLLKTPETGIIPIPLGTDTIIARVNDGSGVFVKHPVRVNSHIVLVTSITLKSDGLNVQIEKDQTFDLAKQITINPENASNKSVKYESLNESIATVDANGVITGVGEVGQTTHIRITSLDRAAKVAESQVTIMAESSPYEELAIDKWKLSSNLVTKEGSFENLLLEDNGKFWAPDIKRRPIYSPACWLDIDLGEVQKIGQIAYRHRSLNYGHLQLHSFKLQVKKLSSDEWKDMGVFETIPLNTDLMQTFEFDPAEVQFVRLNFIKGHLRDGKTDWDYEEDGNVSVGNVKLYRYLK